VGARYLAVPTSGIAERGRHVLDPHTGRPAEGLLSVTVTGPDLGQADGYATAVFAMGYPRALGWSAEGYAAFGITADGGTWRTEDFPAARYQNETIEPQLTRPGGRPIL
jgi:thiamine biosynthesis lipoprotein